MEEREILTVRDLCKTFTLSKRQQKIEKTHEKKKKAVDHLSFTAYEGEIFGLLGPNGAGKTTTLRMLATLIRPDSGDAWMDGASIVTQPELVRRKIGFLTSELKLEDFFTPNQLFQFFGELHQMSRQQIEQRRAELIERFGIGAFAEVKVANLSTGMKQKVSIVISILHDPSIIIFDEPTNGLDVLTAKTVTDFLLELRTQGRTVIVSTHIFSLVEKLCDRVGILINGQMIVCEPLAELTKEKCLEDVFFDIYQKAAGEQNG